MPDKPLWYDRLDVAVEQLAALPSPWVDRATLEFALGVGRRRAQQILAPLVRKTLGKNGLADRGELIQQQLAAGETAYYEKRRRERLHALVEQWHKQADQQPTVMVKASAAVLHQELDSLPVGFHLSPGRMVIEGFHTGDEARQQLLALVLAMGHDPDGFEARITTDRRKSNP